MNSPSPSGLRQTSRREFLVHASVFTAAGLLARSLASAQTAAPAARPAAPAAGVPVFKPLRGGAGYFTARGGTIGWLMNKDALVAVDTQFPDTAGVFLAGLPGRAGRKFDLVLNTHHHADHTNGNSVFKSETKTIVAHANVPALQKAAAEVADKNDNARPWMKSAAQAYADTTFADAWRRDFGSDTVSAKYHGAAHTSGDIIVVFEKANVVHMGDLVFNRLYPVIDRPAGASVRGWIQVLEEAVKTYPADAIYIFGHGSEKFGVTGTRGDLLVMRDYWSAVLARVEKEIAAGKKRAEVVALENLPGFPDFHAPLPNRLGTNLGAAFDELTVKKS